VADIDKAEVIFRQAVAYAAGAMSVNTKLKPGQSQSNYEPLPFILNLSFAIELYLKAMLKIEGKSIRGHKYIPLFNQLSDAIKVAIVTEYGKERKNNNMDLNTFISEITPFDDSFADWRYIFEKSSGTTNLEIYWLVSLANACMNITILNNPTWAKYKSLINQAMS